jgi:hypothetical protein
MVGLALLQEKPELIDEPIIVMPAGGSITSAFVAKLKVGDSCHRLYLDHLMLPTRYCRNHQRLLIYNLNDFDNGIYQIYLRKTKFYVEIEHATVVQMTNNMESAIEWLLHPPKKSSSISETDALVLD